MTRWKWALLITELALFAIILVLPHVNLPACAFHSSTGPVAARSRINFVPAVVIPLQFSLRPPAPEVMRVIGWIALPHYSDARLSLLCTLLC